MKTEAKSSPSWNESGYSLIELLAAMSILLLILSAAFTTFRSMADANTASMQSIEVTQNLQASLTMLRRDLQRATLDVDDQGIPIPDSTAYGRNFLYGIEPGNNSVSVMYKIADGSTSTTLQDNNGDGTRLVVANDDDFGKIRNGDFIRLTNATGDVMQRVTALNTTNKWALFQRTQTATSGGGTGINRGPSDPAISPLFNSNTDATINNFRIYRRITYSLNTTGTTPWLMRQVNEGLSAQNTPGVTKFDLTYQVSPPGGGALAPIISLSDTNNFCNIRRVDIIMTCLSDDAVENGLCSGLWPNYHGKCAPNGIDTSIAIRNYRNRYPN